MLYQSTGNSCPPKYGGIQCRNPNGCGMPSNFRKCNVTQKTFMSQQLKTPCRGVNGLPAPCSKDTDACPLNYGCSVVYNATFGSGIPHLSSYPPKTIIDTVSMPNGNRLACVNTNTLHLQQYGLKPSGGIDDSCPF